MQLCRVQVQRSGVCVVRSFRTQQPAKKKKSLIKRITKHSLDRKASSLHKARKEHESVE